MTMTCPSCHHATGTVLFSATDERFHTTTQTYDIIQCSHCRLTYTSPQPSAQELTSLYPEAFHHEPTGLEQWLTQRSRVALLKDLKRLHPGAKRLLDVGCGTGGFLLEARQAGYDVVGTEYSERAVETARAKGLTVIAGTRPSAVEPDQRFDIVTLLHVLEHVPDPLVELNDIRSLLNPGGLIVIEVPSFNSWERRVFNRHWLHLDVPRHFWHFNAISLTQLLRQSKYQVMAERYALPETTPLSAWHSLTRSARRGPAWLRPIVLAILFTPVVTSSIVCRIFFPRWASPVMRFFACP